jgi:hypothetical protein
MPIPRIENFNNAAKAEITLLNARRRKCIYYKEEICSAPKLQFRLCRTCYRIDIKFTVRRLFEIIRELAEDLFDLPETPPEQPLPAK